VSEQLFLVLGSLPPLVPLALAAAAALAADRLLGRGTRALARRRPWAGGRGPRAAAGLARAGVWLGAGWLAGELHPSLATARSFVEVVGYTVLTAPVFMLNERGWSILDVLEAPFLVLAAWLLVRLAARALDGRLLRAPGVDPGTRQAIVLLARCGLAFAFAMLILQIWGVNVTSLTVAASVVGVGIGFGLQNITSNFVSGILVSLERPIQPGDFVKVGDLMGTVERIGMRSTEIVTLDRVSILIPNSRFLEKDVINWNHGDPVYRLHVPVGVAYGSDPARVKAALLAAADGHPAILNEPRPRVEFHGFGASALDFELLVWAADPKQQYHLLSDLNFRVEASLRAHGVRIPFPRRDIHLPQLDGIVEAWTRRHGLDGAGDGAAVRAADAPIARPAALDGAFDEVHDTRRVTDAQLDRLVERMRGPHGLSIADRRHRLTVYAKCFVGREAVSWMARSLGVTRAEAVAIGRRLVERGTIHHVLDEHSFRDANLYYRFRIDEDGGDPAAAPASHPNL
jgi:small-conductance mechanosensitive channel